jgi:glycosyltransferase involved in cell wall biosynthesis
MKVSVIVPNYNHSKYLRERIDSILNQTYRDFELIILDDFSNDGSRAIIDEYVSKYPDILHFYNGHNSGSAFRQWDHGVRKSTGEFIWIAESDDFAEPGFLEKAVPVLEKNPDTALIYCNSRVIDETRNRNYIVSEQKKHLHPSKWSGDYFNTGRDELEKYLYLNNTINNVSGVLFRRSSYIDAGYADYDMNYCGDWFLYIRMMLISNIAYIAEPLNTIRIHEGSTCHQYFRKSTYFEEMLRIYKFTSLKIQLSFRQKFAIAKILGIVMVHKILNGNLPDTGKSVKIIFSSHLPLNPLKGNYSS